MEKSTPSSNDYVQSNSSISLEELSREINRLNNLFEIHLKRQIDWKIPLRNGILTGLGGILGATIVVSAILYILRPLEKIEAFSPTLKKITEDLDRTKK